MQPYDPFLVWHLNHPESGSCQRYLRPSNAVEDDGNFDSDESWEDWAPGPQRAGYTQRLRSWAVEVVYTSGQGVRNLCLFLVLKDTYFLPADEEPSRMKTRMPRDTSLSPFLEQCLMIGRAQLSFSSVSDQ